MRTHLLRTVYPSPAIEAVEPDTGSAANDDDAPARAPAIAKTAQAPLMTVVATRSIAAADDNDDYYLGGYAGI
jgi:hypothetical protein